MNHHAKSHDEVRKSVRTGYADIATRGSTLGTSSCCGSFQSCYGSQRLAEQIRYSDAEPADLPASAHMGLSCGNSNAIASLKPGEVALDLGSGGGFDCFIAGAERVENTERFAREAGLTDIQLEHKPQYIEAMTSFEDPLNRKIIAALPAGTRPAEFITSLNVTARKPESSSCRPSVPHVFRSSTAT